jgi:asparagine synthase (glutamine-hydrolysing)
VPLPGPIPEGPELLDRVQQLDLETSLAEGLLTKADRAGMSSALELRAPFLDLGVLDYASTLQSSDRVRGLTTKKFLKAYALRYLPHSIVHRRKRGLSVPLATWLRGPLRNWAADRLSDSALESVGVSRKAAQSVFEEHLQRRADHGRALWTLIVLSFWLEWARSPSAQGEPS